MKLIAFLGLFSTLACANSIKVVHYNIKELDSTKIQDGLKRDSEQLQAASNIVQMLNPDILSINEMQYDYPSVPNADYTSEGKNAEYLAQILGMEFTSTAFFPANTGRFSKAKAGEYVLKATAEDRAKYADLVNFGMFPGQYSMAGIFKYPVKSVKNFSNLPWKIFNKKIDLSKYADANGNALPEDMTLFDKNFVDVTLDINGKDVHVILYHTVPAFGFGNSKTPNFERNRDQIKFLSWYLRGRWKKFGIKPIRGKTFIAMGDWNVDPESDNPGAKPLNKLLSKFNPFIKERVITYRGQSFKPNGWSAQLDYMLFSKDIKVKSAGVYDPESKFQDLGCEEGEVVIPEGMVVVNTSKTCRALVSEEYYELLTASDHLPLWAEIEL